MAAKHGSMIREVFERIGKPTIYKWLLLLLAMASNEQLGEMVSLPVKPVMVRAVTKIKKIQEDLFHTLICLYTKELIQDKSIMRSLSNGFEYTNCG
ncbi:unnamed protein product [Dracunculus medinensis]|uniref:Transposase n=1 Tax=Dracunculus medinensis TaxID=318479 RepID=A0A0N4UBF6_DRAME|nr:unnamed protein product [Dracunculus medinensis]